MYKLFKDVKDTLIKGETYLLCYKGFEKNGHPYEEYDVGIWDGDVFNDTDWNYSIGDPYAVAKIPRCEV